MAESKKAATVDKQVLNLINEVKRRKAEIAKIDKPNWKTNCSFAYTELNTNETCNLHVEGSVQLLIKIAAFVLARECDYMGAATNLKIERVPPYAWRGFSAEEWLSDIRARIAKLQISTKQKQLEALETRLNAIISPELRTQMELEAIAAELE